MTQNSVQTQKGKRMASYSITIPGHSSVEMQDGDSLTITFHGNDKFCINSGNANDFSPALPVGQQQSNGSSWTGTAVVANATVTYSHVPNGSQCGAGPGPTAGVPGTIKIGTGK